MQNLLQAVITDYFEFTPTMYKVQKKQKPPEPLVLEFLGDSYYNKTVRTKGVLKDEYRGNMCECGGKVRDINIRLRTSTCRSCGDSRGWSGFLG